MFLYMPKLIYVYCAAHRSNLIINSTCKILYHVLGFFPIITQIYSFFAVFCMTNTCFKHAQIDLGLDEYSIKVFACIF